MKMTLTYGSSYEIIITTKDGYVFKTEIENSPLQDAVDFCDLVFNDETTFKGEMIAKIVIVDSNTGEILAECFSDFECGPTEIEDAYDVDWGYNEDMGYDPYAGCYTDDC